MWFITSKVMEFALFSGTRRFLLCPSFWTESLAMPVNAFLLLLCTEADTVEWRFPQKIATLHEN
jgi:hypothetical protein